VTAAGWEGLQGFRSPHGEFGVFQIACPSLSSSAARICTRLIKEAVGHVNVFAIHCESPQNAASGASLSGLLPPYHFSSLIRIEGPNHS
jgi:hypothetical protein